MYYNMNAYVIISNHYLWYNHSSQINTDRQPTWHAQAKLERCKNDHRSGGENRGRSKISKLFIVVSNDVWWMIVKMVHPEHVRTSGWRWLMVDVQWWLVDGWFLLTSDGQWWVNSKKAGELRALKVFREWAMALFAIFGDDQWLRIGNKRG